MGRKRNIFVREFFAENKVGAQCKVCKKQFGGMYITNLKRHLQVYHPDTEKKMQLEKEQFEKKIKLDVTETQPPKEEIQIHKNDIPFKFTIEMSVNQVINACGEMMTKDKLPIELFDSNGFKKLTEQIFDGLEMERITSENILAYVSNVMKPAKVVLQKQIKKI